MAKIFYDHLILIDEVWSEIETLEISPTEKKLAKKHVDEILHHRIFTFILDTLPPQYHKEFMERVYASPKDIKHLAYLEEKIRRDIQMDLVTLGMQIKKEILSEVKKHSKRKSHDR